MRLSKLNIAVVVVLVLLASLVASEGSAADKRVPPNCTAKEFKPFSHKVWHLDLWKRDKVPHKASVAKRERMGCAPSGAHRKVMKKTWREDRRLFGRYQLYREIAPFKGPCFDGAKRAPSDGCWWAIPAYIVCGESGYNFHQTSGAYGFLQGWAEWGGLKFAPYAGAATPLQQHIVAHRGWLAGGIWTGSC